MVGSFRVSGVDGRRMRGSRDTAVILDPQPDYRCGKFSSNQSLHIEQQRSVIGDLRRGNDIEIDDPDSLVRQHIVCEAPVL